MKITTLGAISAVLAVSAVAGAQTVKPAGVSLRAGVFFPTNDSTRDATSDSFFAFGADYKLTDLSLSVPGYRSSLSLSVDYYSRNDFSNIPVLVNYVGRSGRFGWEAGVGVGFSSLPSGDDTKFAYGAGVSYDITSGAQLPLFVSAKFFGTESDKLNGVGVYLGIRF